MPFRSGLRSGVRGPLYADGACAAGGRAGVAPRCACTPPVAMPMASTATDAATPMIDLFIVTRESLPRFGRRDNMAIIAISGTPRAKRQHRRVERPADAVLARGPRGRG